MADSPVPQDEGAGNQTLPLVLTIDQLAGFLQVSKDTAYRMCRKGSIHARKVEGQWRIPRYALVNYLAKDVDDVGKFIGEFRRQHVPEEERRDDPDWETLAQTVKEVARKSLGRELTDDERTTLAKALKGEAPPVREEGGEL